MSLNIFNDENYIMEIRTESNTTIETNGFFDGNELKTHNCKIGEWWGEEICKKIEIDNKIHNMGIPKGEYNIKIILNKINS